MREQSSAAAAYSRNIFSNNSGADEKRSRPSSGTKKITEAMSNESTASCHPLACFPSWKFRRQKGPHARRETRQENQSYLDPAHYRFAMVCRFDRADPDRSRSRCPTSCLSEFSGVALPMRAPSMFASTGISTRLAVGLLRAASSVSTLHHSSLLAGFGIHGFTAAKVGTQIAFP